MYLCKLSAHSFDSMHTCKLTIEMREHPIIWQIRWGTKCFPGLFLQTEHKSTLSSPSAHHSGRYFSCSSLWFVWTVWKGNQRSALIKGQMQMCRIEGRSESSRVCATSTGSTFSPRLWPGTVEQIPGSGAGIWFSLNEFDQQTGSLHHRHPETQTQLKVQWCSEENHWSHVAPVNRKTAPPPGECWVLQNQLWKRHKIYCSLFQTDPSLLVRRYRWSSTAAGPPGSNVLDSEIRGWQ